jgi:HlyD family secretion protein
MSSEPQSPREPVSGGAMDKVVERRGIPTKIKAGIAAGALAIAGIAFYAYAPSGNSQTVAADRVTVSTVQRGTFDDFLPLRARVTPLLTIYLDSVEGGRVEEKLVEDGATVQKGQLLAVLSNPELQLSVLARQTDVSRELNSMRSQELALAQTRMSDERNLLEAKLAFEKAQRQYKREAPLAARGFIPSKQFADTKDDLEFQRQRYDLLQRTQATDERLQSSQLGQLRQSSSSMSTSLDLARLNLESLKLRAPVSGQLSGFDIQVGQKAVIDQGGKTYPLKVTKIYPQVRNGQFEVDLQFQGPEPAGLQRGQTLQAKLTLGDPAPALLIPNGSFYNDTGGAWVFVVTDDGKEAVKRNVRLGRRNADFIEVLDGLQPGEKVLTSPYTGFADKDRLDLQQK